MRQKLFPFIIALLLFSSCNKEIESVPVPPFLVFPNPCKGAVQVTLLPSVTSPANIKLYGRDGKTLYNATLPPQTTNAYQLQEEGIYYLEVVIDNQLFKAEIVNLE